MAEVKWVKFKVGTFDGVSFKRIKKAKIGGESYRDKLTAVWFELLDLAGKYNNEGFLYSDELPYGSYEDIAMMIDRDIDEIRLCMEFYITNGMIEIIDDLFLLSNWNKYQNIEGMEKIREQNRVRQKKFYDRKKAEKLECNVTPNVIPNVSITQPNAPRIKNKEERNKNINNTCSNEQAFEHESEHNLNTIDVLFDAFWNVYPRKVGKQRCLNWFKTRKPSERLVEKMIITINLWKKTSEWLKENGRFVPHPYTWLNRGGWEDIPVNNYPTTDDEDENGGLETL